MQCTSAYPCSLDQVGLNVFQELRDRYGEEVKIGFSDHTSGLAAGTAAAALGATVIEKHLTFSTAMFGSDAANALEPKDFSMYTLARAMTEEFINALGKLDDGVYDYIRMRSSDKHTWWQNLTSHISQTNPYGKLLKIMTHSKYDWDLGQEANDDNMSLEEKP